MYVQIMANITLPENVDDIKLDKKVFPLFYFSDG